MLNTLTTIVAFAVAIGILVTVHEFGHYWVARRLGVKVLKFSVGFGRALVSRRWGRDRTEYAIALLPLGGYVKMLDEREGAVEPAEQHRAFNRQALWKRAAILFAGPAFNLLLAVLCYWVVFMSGIPGLKPVVGQVSGESPAAVAGFRGGDEIVAVGGSPTPTWQATRLELLESIMAGDAVMVRVKGKDGTTRTLQLKLLNSKKLTRPGALLPGLGIVPWRANPPAVVDQILADSAAAAAGLRAGDKIVAIGDQQVGSWRELVQFVRKRPNERLAVTVLRDGERLTLPVRIGAVESGNHKIGRLGVAVKASSDVAARMYVVRQFGPLASISRAFVRTGEISGLTLRGLFSMVTGQMSWKNLSGPITIARYAGRAASAGITAFATFLAVISISLGILNLLPIPLLDGGQLLYCLIEWVKGEPLSSRSEMIGQQIGMTLLLLLMGFAVFNDLARVAG